MTQACVWRKCVLHHLPSTNRLSGMNKESSVLSWLGISHCCTSRSRTSYSNSNSSSSSYSSSSSNRPQMSIQVQIQHWISYAFKGKVFRGHTVTSYRGSRGIAVVSLSLGTTWRCGANIMPWLESTVVPIEWGGWVSPSAGQGILEKIKVTCTCQHTNPNWPASSLVTFLTALSWLLSCAFSGWELIVCLRKNAKFSVRHNIYFLSEVRATCCGLIN